MKVFKMNDCDWVCAENEEQAKEHYKKETDFDDLEIGEFFEGEVSLNTTMLTNMDDLSIEQLKGQQEIVDGNWVRQTFSEVIEKEQIVKPCIIASTEY